VLPRASNYLKRSHTVFFKVAFVSSEFIASRSLNTAIHTIDPAIYSVNSTKYSDIVISICVAEDGTAARAEGCRRFFSSIVGVN
jgi:hypothetical protein